MVDSKIVGQSIQFEWKPLSYDDIFTSGTVNIDLKDRIPKEDNNELIFNLLGEVMDENFLTSKLKKRLKGF